MKAKKYLIVDDSTADSDLLRQHMTSLPLMELAGVCKTIEEAMHMLASEKINLLFLDIELNNQSGLSLLKTCTDLPPVIITSAHADYAVESYAIGKASDYLVKPYSYERLLIALDRALSIRMSSSSLMEGNYIFLKMGRQISRFEFSAIDYVEAYGAYTKVYCGSKLSLVNERLLTMAELLPSHLFMRVHKSYIINITKIIGYNRSYLILPSAKIPIGDSYRQKLSGLLRLFDRVEGVE